LDKAEGNQRRRAHLRAPIRYQKLNRAQTG
jgi:hypothetical protein